MSCSTRTMVWRRLSEDSRPIMRCDSSCPMPAMGSSRSSSRGRVASDMDTSSGRRQAGDVLAREADGPGVGAQGSRELVDEGGLAGAVGPDDRVRLALGDMEIDAVARAQRAEALAKAFYLKHRA